MSNTPIPSDTCPNWFNTLIQKSGKTIFLALLLSSLSPIVLFAQTRVDSLENRLEQLTGPARLLPLSQLVTALSSIAPRQALAYCEEGLLLLNSYPDDALHRELSFQKGKALFFDAYIHKQSYAATKSYIEQVLPKNSDTRTSDFHFLDGWIAYGEERLLEAVTSVTTALETYEIHDERGRMAESYHLLSKVFGQLNQSENAISNFEQAITLYEDQRDYLNAAAALKELGRLFYYQTKGYEQGLLAFNRSLQLYQTHGGSEEDIADILNNIGNVQIELGNYDASLTAYNQSLVLREKNNNVHGVALVINNMGDVYKYLDQYDEALSLFERSLELQKDIGDTGGIAWTLGDIADTYRNMGIYDKALSYFNQSLTLKEELGHESSVAWTLNDIGALHSDFNDLDAAIDAFSRAQQIYKKLGDPHGNATALHNLAGVYLKMGHLDSALASTERVLSTADSIGVLMLVRDAHLQRATILENQNRYAEALMAYKNYKAINDSLFTEAGQGIVAELQQQYHAREQKQKIDFLESNRAQQRLLLFAMLAGVLLLIAFLTLLAFQMRQRRRSMMDLKAANQQVQEKAMALERANEHKSRFLASISHEFRTPLTLTFGPLDDALSGRFTSLEEAHPYFESARRNGSRLLNLINQLLDLSKLDAGALLLQAHTHDLSEHTKQLAALFEPLAEKKVIQFTVEIDEQELLVVYDADKIEKVIVNLLSNAFKFTPVGGQVILTLKHQGDSGVTLSVADTGEGLDPEHIPYLFDRFYQADNTLTRAHEGTGIGLALVKELVTLHEGTITVESQPTLGTRFEVFLPHIAPTEEAQYTALPSSSLNSDAYRHTVQPSIDTDAGTYGESTHEPSSDEKPLILIIEDNADMRAYISGHLKTNFDVYEAPDGRAGVEKAFEIIPDLVVSDVMMPEMDGLDVCSTLKENERSSHIPIVLLTARGSVENRIAGYESGADAYLPKPFNSEELLVRVSNLIEERNRLRAKFSIQSAINEEVNEQSPSLEPAFKQTGEGDATNLKPERAVPPREAAFLQKVETLVEACLDDSQFGVDRMAETINMSRRQLHRKVLALTGETPATIIRQLRLRKAAELLRADVLSVKEIRHAVGFQSESSFARAFRLVYNVPPSEYRASFR